MDPTNTLDITSLVGILQRIVEFALHLLDHGSVALSLFFIRLMVPCNNIINIFSHAPVVVGFSTNTIFTISGSL